jgi:hypothetical protein
MLTQMVPRPKIIVSPFATETREIIEDVRLPGRGFVIHRKVDRPFPAAYQMGDDTILIHPEIEQQVREHLAASIERDINASFLGGLNVR